MPIATPSSSRNVLALLVRHGHTAFNDPASPRVRAWEDVPLSRAGELDSQLAASKLRFFRPKMIYHSDLARDTQMAEIIGNILGLPNESNYALRTHNMGEWSGMPESEVNHLIVNWMKHPWMAAPSGESWQDGWKRFFGAYDVICKSAADNKALRPVVILSHGRPISALHAYYTGLQPWEASMPLPGGIAVVRGSGTPTDDFIFLSETEPIVQDN